MRSAILGLAALGLLVTGCSGDPEPPAPDPTAVAPVEPAWNPCSSLDADAVIARLGATYSVRRGTAQEPVCTFVPDNDGDPVVDINYNTFTGSLPELLATFGVDGTGSTKVRIPEIPGAKDARVLATRGDDDTLRITGFVRNGLLVQVVNVLDPAPFDEKDVLRDVTSLMADLAAGAKASGLTG